MFRNHKKGKKGIKRIKNAFKYSIEGLKTAWSDEEAFRQIFILAVIFTILGFFCGETWEQKILLILPCFFCVSAELINSAIENAVDFTSIEIHPLAKKAKDIASALQFVSIIFFILVWGSFIVLKFLI